MKAKSINGKSVQEIKSALIESMSDGFKPTLAFVFISIKHERNEIISIMNSYNIQIFGVTSSGEICDSEVLRESISILLMDMNRANFKILLEEYGKTDPVELAKTMTGNAMKLYEKPAFILSNSVADITEMAVSEKILYSISEVAGKDAVIWGGGAGDDLRFKETFTFTNNKKTNNGILLLVIDNNNVIVKGRAATGQKPVGTQKTITKVEDNWILEIDNQPAAELMPKFLGLNLTEEKYKEFNIGTVILSLSKEKGEPLIRSSMGLNWDNKGLAVSGRVKVGDRIRLTLPPDFEVIEEVSADAKKIQSAEMPEADALLMFSCIGRLDVFGPLTSDEVNGIRNAFKVPMAGFFTYGEYGRATGGDNEFHNMTCCWVALKEK
ncbi:MAG TPA: FIST N-terminal domain-containing protein [Melioribacteraceae bacterium]|nr:FIST N-terminal domain-containing protein [Melioribacteraceae bacterium]